MITWWLHSVLSCRLGCSGGSLLLTLCWLHWPPPPSGQSPDTSRARSCTQLHGCNDEGLVHTDPPLSQPWAVGPRAERAVYTASVGPCGGAGSGGRTCSLSGGGQGGQVSTVGHGGELSAGSGKKCPQCSMVAGGTRDGECTMDSSLWGTPAWVHPRPPSGGLRGPTGTHGDSLVPMETGWSARGGPLAPTQEPGRVLVPPSHGGQAPAVGLAWGAPSQVRPL